MQKYTAYAAALIIGAALWFGGALTAHAANHYIRAGANGNNDGSNWTNAWTDLPRTFVRGDTYYVADGTYGGHSFSTAESGTLVITVKKATVSDHGTGTGWLDAYGDGQAMFTANPPDFQALITFSTDYWVFDGIYRDEQSWDNQNAYGFALHIMKPSSYQNKIVLINNGADNITIRYCDMEQAGMQTNLRQDGILGFASTDGGSQNITITHNYIHHLNRSGILARYFTNWDIGYNEIAFIDDYSDPYMHREAIACGYSGTNISIHHNRFHDIIGRPGSPGASVTAVIGILDTETPISGLKIYGNIFWDTFSANGIIATDAGSTLNNSVIHNNTFYDISGLGGISVGFSVDSGTGNSARNNVWYNSTHVPEFRNITHDNNGSTTDLGESNDIYVSSNPFETWFIPSETSDILDCADTSVSSVYRTDHNGIVHDELGAVAFGGEPPPPPPPPPPPTIPEIASVTINPNSGIAKIGSSITINVVEATGLAGLTASDAQINGKSIPLSDVGAGTYRGTYIIQEGDANGVNVEATNITLTGEGGTSGTKSSTGSSLVIDAGRPAIESVTLNPNTGSLYPGDMVDISVSAVNGETGLYPTQASFLGRSVFLSERGGGLYGGYYTIQEDDAASGSFGANALFTDDFESGAFSKWSYVSAGIQQSSISKFGAGAVEYDIQSTTERYMNVALGSSVPDSYVSFYFRLDPSFTMLDGNTMYVNMMRSGSTYPWAFRLRREAGALQVVVTLDAYQTDVGQWQTILPGQWYWVKVHLNSATNGILQWWMNGTTRGSYTGDTSGRALDKLYAVSLGSLDAGTSGKMYWDHFQITTSDHTEPVGGVIEATGITLIDIAGNVSDPASSSGSTLEIAEVVEPETEPPSIASVTLTPNTGTRKIGSTVSITATATGNEAGLTPSPATFNGKQIPLADQGDGRYIGVYVVTEGDNDAVNPNATGITLTGTNGTSTPASSSGSTLRIDAHAPQVSSVQINPNSGTVTVGGTVTITVTAANSEAGLTASNAMLNGTSIPLTGQGDGTYTGTYTVSDGDAAGTNVEATGITLVDAAGNSSAIASSSGSTLAVVITPPESAPVIQSVTLTPSSGLLKIGDTILVTVTAANNQIGLTPSTATVNGRQIQLTGQGDGTYAGYYTVIENDPDASTTKATGITLTGSGGTSATASSSGQGPAIDAHRPGITSVSLTPNTGYIGTGDTVTITVNTTNNEAGLTISNAQLNGKYIPMSDQGDGSYVGTYTVAENDIQGINIMAANIVLTDTAGNVSIPGHSSGSTLIVDTRAPVVLSVLLSPHSGVVMPGDAVSITATALGNEAGLTPSTASINGRTIPLSDIGGGQYRGIYAVMESDIEGENIEATGITLTDFAGNVSAPGSSIGSTLSVSTVVDAPSQYAPVITEVRLVPSTGALKVGDQVTIEVYAADNTTGLTASNALFNETLVELSDLGNGLYSGVYTVQEGHVDGINVEATGITLSNQDGTSASASSTGSTITIDAHTPKISMVNISPHNGWVRTGSIIKVTVKAINNEAGLTPSNATVNGVPVSLIDAGDGNYTGSYIVRQNDIQGINVEATGITLTDAAGNVSEVGASSGSTLRIDTIIPVIESVEISPNTGTITIGDEVRVTVTSADRETGLIGLSALINLRSVSLIDMGDGTYQGVYRVGEGDYPGHNIEATNVILKDAAGNTSATGSSFGSTLDVIIEEPTSPPVKPEIESVTLSPNSGVVKVGDTVTITVVEAHGLTGLTPSEVTFNNRQLVLMDNGNGSYYAVYQVLEGDFDAVNVQAKNITLTGAGGTTILTSSSGSTLSIDANTPVVHSVELIPIEVTVGQSVIILVTAEQNESGLLASDAYVNGAAVSLRDQGDGTYRGLYTIQDEDLRGQQIEVSDITLTDMAGNVSESGPTAFLTIIDDRDDTFPIGDIVAPQVSSVTISPQSGWVKAGDEITITVTARNAEEGLTVSPAFINNEFVPLAELGMGTYGGIYTVREGDSQGRNIEAMGITLTDAADNVSASASSFGSTLSVDTDVPFIQKVDLSSPTGKILGVLGTGQSVSIIVTARQRETGLIASNASINGKSIPLADQGDGTYRGTYTISENDPAGENIEATGITLTDLAGNVSEPGASSGSGLSVNNTPAVAPEETDFNDDGSVSFTDFTLFILAYGEHEGSPGWDRKYDLNRDGEVGLDDFYIFVGNYGKKSNKAAKAAVAVSIPPQSDIGMDLALEVDDVNDMTYAHITVSDPDALNGLEFSLSYDTNAYEYDEDSVNGLVGLSIPVFTDGNILIASVFPTEEFSGTITLGFRHTGMFSLTGIEIEDAMVIESDGVARIPILPGNTGGEPPAAFIYDLMVERVSEDFAQLAFTAPAIEGVTGEVTGYVVETSHAAPDGGGWETTNSITVTDDPTEPGTVGTVRVEGLKPGMPYYLALRPVVGNIAASRSNIVKTQTLARFIDDDLDFDDPFIIRDRDSLFVADNDTHISFEWSSWADLGASGYMVTVTTGGASSGTTEAIIVQDTDFTVESGSGTTVSISVKPITEGGDSLGVISSRTILCAPGELDKPGKPSMVTPGQSDDITQ